MRVRSVTSRRRPSSSLLEVTRECLRVLKPSGSLWVNLGDKYSGAQQQSSGRESSVSSSEYWKRTNPKTTGVKAKSLYGIPWRYALACIDDLGLILRAEVIWSKPNGLPESVTDRVRRSHEQWFHFTLEPRYFSAVDEIREGYEAEHKVRGREPNSGFPGKDRHPATTERSPLGKLPGSVWTIPTEPLRVPDHLGIDHFAAFPTEWPKRIIRGWSPEGGTVLDPFGGTGTTALVAKALGRHGISVDMSADYCRLAGWRTNDRDQLAKVLGIEKAAPVAADEQSLLDLIEGPAA
jgi:DNA modification methylase